MRPLAFLAAAALLCRRMRLEEGFGAAHDTASSADDHRHILALAAAG